MSRQEKAQTERNARILRDLVKQPDNKACADCRKNDARWASWNLGVFLCIRCSGIHRSMGTHISKVKSIDLDIWTPEQMDSVQKWGNRRANLYWERHLKAGHIPPEHKIESFIRSKYESRRWAMDGPPPKDPSVLEDGAAQPQQQAPPVDRASRPTPTAPAAPPKPASPPSAAPRQHPLLSRQTQAKAHPAGPTQQAQPLFDIFGDEPAPAAAAPTAAPVPQARSPPAVTAATAPGPTPAAAPSAPASNIYDLDFKAPSAAPRAQTAKADIMSLFSQPAAGPAVAPGGFFAATNAPPPQANPYGSWNGGITSTAPQQSPTQAPLPAQNSWGGFNDQAAWGAPQQAQQPPQQQQPAQSQWGQPAQPTQQQWGSPTTQPQQQVQWGAAPVQSQPVQQQWGQAPQQPANNLWGATAADPWAQPVAAPAPPKKDTRDPFANIWE